MGVTTVVVSIQIDHVKFNIGTLGLDNHHLSLFNV